MSLFADLMGKIFGHHAGTPAAGAPASTPVSLPDPLAPATSAGVGPAPSAAPMGITPSTPGAPASTAPAMAAAAGQPAAPVDVAAILDGLAATNSESLDWKKSIVDLMKLVGMDSSLTARKTLAKELNYTGDTNDSATMNVWLHKAVMQKLAQNGGKIPQNLL